MGVDVPVAGILRSLDARVDSVIGADRLNAESRSQLLGEQVQAIARLTPATAVGGLLVAATVLWVGRNLPVFPALAAWSAALALSIVVSLLHWRRASRVPARSSEAAAAVRQAILGSAVTGLVWGALPLIGLHDGDALLKTLVAIVVAGVLCAAGFALLILPQAAAAFSLPLLACSVIAVAGLADPTESAALSVLLAVYAVVMTLVCLRYSRNLVQHLISEAKVAEQKNIISLLLKEFEDNSSDWLWELDRHGCLQRVSDRFSVAAGIAREQMVGVELRTLLSTMSAGAGDDDPAAEELARAIDARRTFNGIELRLSIDGSERCWRLTGKPVFDSGGAHAGYIGTSSDVTAAKLSERRINYLAHNDALTGLLNRAKFTEHLKQSVGRLERYGTPFVLLYLDLDQFKAVNDSRGHLIGDRLLAQVGKRIKAVLRESDVVARLGGDEFAIILNNSSDTDETAVLAQRLLESVSRQYEFDEEIVVIGLSIGIAMAPVNGTRSDQILRNADLALYRAKAEGRGNHRFFESQMDSDVRERRMLELELRQALKDGELVLHYQPLVSAEDNRPSGFEALVRWNHPIRGLVPPAEFIPIAEQTGLIRQVGDWTIREACHAAVRWPHALVVAVNLSARHFQLSDIAAVIGAALEESGLAPQRLEIEITESLLIDRPEDVVEKLTRIKALGVTIAMDDFGTGYSSLSYLLKFPFDKIKIDKSFVTASSEDVVARDILRSIATLGKTLDIDITAEGVETMEQVEFLREIACSQLQGFYFAKPLNELDLSRYFRQQFDPLMGRSDDGSAARRLAG